MATNSIVPSPSVLAALLAELVALVQSADPSSPVAGLTPPAPSPATNNVPAPPSSDLRLVATRSGVRLEPLQVTIAEAARLLGYSRSTFDHLVKSGEIPAIGDRRLRRVALADLRAYQARHRRGGTDGA